MLLFWMTFNTSKGTAVFIQSGYSLVDARLKASMAGASDDLKEALELDTKTAKKVRKI